MTQSAQTYKYRRVHLKWYYADGMQLVIDEDIHLPDVDVVAFNDTFAQYQGTMWKVSGIREHSLGRHLLVLVDYDDYETGSNK